MSHMQMILYSQYSSCQPVPDQLCESLTVYTHGRIAPALAISWGLVWIAVARTSGQFEAPSIVWAAAIAAAVVLVATIGLRIVAERQNAKAW